MNVSQETKVKDLAVTSEAARRILEEAGVDYCVFLRRRPPSTTSENS